MRRIIDRSWGTQIEVMDPETEKIDREWCDYNVICQHIYIKGGETVDGRHTHYVVRVPRKLWFWQRRKLAVQRGILLHKQKILTTEWDSSSGYIRAAIED
jgi:hypothetical protein